MHIAKKFAVLLAAAVFVAGCDESVDTKAQREIGKLEERNAHLNASLREAEMQALRLRERVEDAKLDLVEIRRSRDSLAGLLTLGLRGPEHIAERALQSVYDEREEVSRMVEVSYALRAHFTDQGLELSLFKKIVDLVSTNAHVREAVYAALKDSAVSRNIARRYAGLLQQAEPVMGKFSPEIGDLARRSRADCMYQTIKVECKDIRDRIAAWYSLESHALTNEQIWVIGALNRRYLDGGDGLVKFTMKAYGHLLALASAEPAIIAN